MIIYLNEKMSADKLARLLVFDKGASATFWFEDVNLDSEKLTKKEIENIERSVEKHIDRISRFLKVIG